MVEHFVGLCFFFTESFSPAVYSKLFAPGIFVQMKPMLNYMCITVHQKFCFKWKPQRTAHLVSCFSVFCAILVQINWLCESSKFKLSEFVQKWKIPSLWFIYFGICQNFKPSLFTFHAAHWSFGHRKTGLVSNVCLLLCSIIASFKWSITQLPSLMNKGKEST